MASTLKVPTAQNLAAVHERVSYLPPQQGASLGHNDEDPDAAIRAHAVAQQAYVSAVQAKLDEDAADAEAQRHQDFEDLLESKQIAVSQDGTSITLQGPIAHAMNKAAAGVAAAGQNGRFGSGLQVSTVPGGNATQIIFTPVAPVLTQAAAYGLPAGMVPSHHTLLGHPPEQSTSAWVGGITGAPVGYSQPALPRASVPVHHPDYDPTISITFYTQSQDARVQHTVYGGRHGIDQYFGKLHEYGLELSPRELENLVAMAYAAIQIQKEQMRAHADHQHRHLG